MKFPRNGSGFLAVCLLLVVFESSTGQVIFEDDDPPPKPQPGRPSRPPPNGNFEDDDPTTRFFPLQNLQLGQLGQLGVQVGQQLTGLLGQFLNPQRPGGGGGGNAIGGACRSFEGDPGVCTRLNACQELVAILNNSPGRQAQRILRRSICGVTGLAPLVCCPSPTPGGGFPGPEQGGGFNGGNRPDNGFGGGRPGAGGQNPGKQPGEGGFQGGNRPGGEKPGGGGGFQGGNRPEGGNQNGGNQPGGGFQGGNRPGGGGFQGGNQPGGGGGFQGGNQPGGGFQGGNQPGGGFQGGNRPVNPGGNEDFTFGGGNGGGGGFQGGNVSPQPIVTTPKPTTTTTSTPTTRPPTPSTTTQPAGGGILPPGQGGFVKPGEVVPEFDGRGLKIPGTELPCGISNVSSVRVVGGKESPVGAWPWLTALGFREAESGGINFLCGGALVSQQHVLTAAHCVHERNDLELIRVGDHNLYSDKDGLTPVDVPIAQIIKHPNYDPKTFQNDIAVLKLKRKVDFTKYVQPICLPNTPEMRSQRFSNTIPFIAGWGALSFNGASSATLQQAQVPTIEPSICAEKYKQFKTSRIDDTNICAGFPTGRIDACQGDSGGPMMLPIKGGNPHIIIGVVSYGFRCAEPNFPGIYTRVTAFSDWIDNAITSTYDP